MSLVWDQEPMSRSNTTAVVRRGYRHLRRRRFVRSTPSVAPEYTPAVTIASGVLVGPAIAADNDHPHTDELVGTAGVLATIRQAEAEFERGEGLSAEAFRALVLGDETS